LAHRGTARRLLKGADLWNNRGNYIFGVTAMLDRDGYRPNVAIVVVNAKNQVFWGKRVREHSWQFPSGSIPVKRPSRRCTELNEEVGSSRNTSGSWVARDRLATVPQHWVKREWRVLPRAEADLVPAWLVGRDTDVSLRATEHRSLTRGAGTSIAPSNP
jgi:putative (di)nucleoside polyphosphate hydrolase